MKPSKILKIIDVDKLDVDGAVGHHLGPVHGTLELGDIDAAGVLLSL